MSGLRHLRNLVTRSGFRVVQPDGAAGPRGDDYANVVQLDHSEYTEVQ